MADNSVEMTRLARERLREARAVAQVMRDLAHVLHSYLDDPELLEQPAWLHRVERLAGRLKAESRRLEDTIYEARYYHRRRRAGDASRPAAATPSRPEPELESNPLGTEPRAAASPGDRR